MRREMILRNPIADFAAAMRVERSRVEAGDMLDAALLREDPAPERILARANAGDRSDAGDDCPALLSVAHRSGGELVLRLEVRLHAAQRLTRDMVDEESADDLIGDAARARARGNCRSCTMLTSTPAGRVVRTSRRRASLS